MNLTEGPKCVGYFMCHNMLHLYKRIPSTWWAQGPCRYVLVCFSYRKRRRVRCAVDGRLGHFISSTSDERRICERCILTSLCHVFIRCSRRLTNAFRILNALFLFLKKRLCLWWTNILKHRYSSRLSTIGSVLRALVHWSKNSAFKFYAV